MGGSQEMAHYAKRASDIEFKYPFGWGELWGVADRGVYDLSTHAKASGQRVDMLDTATNKVRPQPAPRCRQRRSPRATTSVSCPT